MTGYRPLLLMLTLLLPWGPGGAAVSEEARLSGLNVSVKQEQTRPPGDEQLFVRDAPNRLVLVLVNDSDDYLVIRSLQVAEGLPDIERRYGSRYGATFYQPLEDEWHYNEFAQQLSKPLFASGVIPPGGVMETVRWAVLRQEKLALEAVYHRLTPRQAAQAFYLADHQGAAMTQERVFRRYRAEDLEASLHGGPLDWRTVIIPQLQSYRAVSRRLATGVTLRSPEFSRDAAQQKLDEPAVQALYRPGAGRWAMRTRRGWMSVGPGDVRPLPELDHLVFLLIESLDPVPLILPLQGYRDLGAVAPAVRGPGYFDPGVSRLPRSALEGVFERARDKGHTLSPLVFDPNGLANKLYLLVGDFDPQKRRELARERERLLYFPSPEAAVERMSELLRDQNWGRLACYYDLTDSGIDRADLQSGSFFYHEEPSPIGHPAGFDRYRHPFAPGFRFLSSRPTAEPDVVEVTVAVSIDQGAGPPQRGLRRFLMSRSENGFQLLPHEPGKTRSGTAPPIPSAAGLRTLSAKRLQLRQRLDLLRQRHQALSANPVSSAGIQKVKREIAEVEARLGELNGMQEALESRMNSGRSLSVRERPGLPSRR